MWHTLRQSGIIMHAMKRGYAATQFPSSFSLSHAMSRYLSSFIIRVPSLGDSITDCSVAELTKRAGDAVSTDEVVARLDTDKVSVDVRSSVSGRVKLVKAQVAATLKVGEGLFEIDVADGAASTPSSSSSTTSSSSSAEPAGLYQQPSAPPSIENAATTSHSPQPHATSGLQHPINAHHTEAGRKPSIQFKYGKRSVVASHLSPITKSPSHPHSHSSSSSSSSSSSASASSLSFQEMNERAAQAFEALPNKYKKKIWTDLAQQIVELGGAMPYEARKKSRD